MPTAELRAIAQSQGMKSLRQAGLMKVIEGTTTVEEVLRVTLS
jgi:type II secretory ATPase GspE/PulE/Tfp pilus assembly ATPase PilB-like protein